MGIELVRIDDRLIHGQVVTTWVKQKQIQQILIINDAIVNDEVQKSIFDITAPPDVIVKTFGVQSFIDITKKTAIKRRTLLLFTNPNDVLKLVKGGVKISHLNLGGMKFKTGRRQYTRAVSMSPEEFTALKELDKFGIEIFVQMVPVDKVIKLDELLKGEVK